MKFVSDKIDENSERLAETILSMNMLSKPELVKKISSWFQIAILDVMTDEKFRIENEKKLLVEQLNGCNNTRERINIQTKLSVLNVDLKQINIIYDAAYNKSMYFVFRGEVIDLLGLEETVKVIKRAEKKFEENLSLLKIKIDKK